MGEFAEKVNSTRNQRLIKIALEQKGHTGVEVWWEPLSGACEMCGIAGGYFMVSNQCAHEPMGLSLNEAMKKAYAMRQVSAPSGAGEGTR